MEKKQMNSLEVKKNNRKEKWILVILGGAFVCNILYAILSYDDYYNTYGQMSSLFHLIIFWGPHIMVTVLLAILYIILIKQMRKKGSKSDKGN